MASYGYTFNSGDGVTPTRLNAARTVSDIVNADIKSDAAIALSKLATGALPAAITVASANLVDGTIVNADINASAAIAYNKLANITAGQVLLGNASNVPTATALSGDVTVNSSGVTAIGSGVIVDADVNASAAIALSKLATGALPSGITVASANIVDGTIVNADIGASAAIAHNKLANITAGQVLLGNASNVPTATALSGDVTVNSSGVTAIGAGVIVNADVSASAAIDGTKISPDFGSQNIETTGRLLLNTTTAFSTSARTPFLQLHSASDLARTEIGFFNFENNSNPGVISFCKSRAGSLASHAIAQNGDDLGFIAFEGSDGSKFVRAATIRAAVDGTPGANDMPGRLVFSTTADGASSPTERMRIDSDGISVSGAATISGNTTLSGWLSVANQVDAGLEYRVGNVKVVSSRITGWAAATGTATRTSFATSTVTTAQLAERVKALIDDLRTHGLIGN